MRCQVVELGEGFEINGEFFKTVTLREPRVADMLTAEQEAPENGKSLAFRAALIAACIEKVEGYDGMVTFKMIAGLSLTDFDLLLSTQSNLDEKGAKETKKD